MKEGADISLYHRMDYLVHYRSVKGRKKQMRALSENIEQQRMGGESVIVERISDCRSGYFKSG